MKYLFLLIPFAAHAAASPCDPRCDPKPKAQVSVVCSDSKGKTVVAGGNGIVFTTNSPRSTPAAAATVPSDACADELVRAQSSLEEAARGVRAAAQTERAQALTTKKDLLEAAREAYAASLKSLSSTSALAGQAEVEAALLSSNRALAEAVEAAKQRGARLAYVDPSVWDAADGQDDDPEGQDLESRIRALERIARKQGHGTGGGSLEDRVAALERALAGSKSAPAPLATTPRAYYLDEVGKLHGFPQQDTQRLRGLRGSATTPTPRAPRSPKVARSAPPPPAPAEPPAPAAPPSGLLHRDRPDAPAPDASPFFRRSQIDGEQRREIENAMRELRSEADALRAELHRMREKIEALPRSGAR